MNVKKNIEMLVNAGGDIYLPNKNGIMSIDCFSPEIQEYYRGRNIKPAIKSNQNN